MHLSLVFAIFLVLMSSLVTSNSIVEPPPAQCIKEPCCKGQYPVCGRNGVTYDSYCSMKEAGQEMKYDGKCKEPNNDKGC